MELVGSLDHPNIVKATDAGEVDGTCFLVMEYLIGHDLKTILNSEGSISVTEACSILRQVANGLEYIHENKLIHRDIKPSNLFLTTDGRVKILDLGLAGLSDSEGDDSELTDSNCIMGSAHYMAPEQAKSIKTIDQRSDIYSLGCTFFRLLTGEAPFSKESQVETIIAHREEAAPRLADHLSEIPEDIEELFQSMVAKDPDDRIQTMAEVVKKLDPLLTNENNLPFNENSDTHVTDSQVLKHLYQNVELISKLAEVEHFPSTQRQIRLRYFNKKTTMLLASILVLTTAGMAGIFLRPETPDTVKLPDENNEPVVSEPVLDPVAPPIQIQWENERNQAIWALNLGCVIDIKDLNGKDVEKLKEVESLPDEDFSITKIKFPGGFYLTHETMNHLRDLSTLKALLLDDCVIYEDSLEPIKNLNTLEKLDLHNTGLTDKGLSHVSGLTNLIKISLQSNPKLTDEGLQALNQFRNLTSVNLAKLNITDKGLIFVQHNLQLDWVNISGTNVTDKSVKFLIKLDLLEELYLSNSFITANGRDAIRKAFKNLNPIID